MEHLNAREINTIRGELHSNRTRSKDDYRCNLIRWLKSQLLIGMAGGVHAYTLKSGFESEWGFIE